jgi:REP element-mobilizing transposase RayT
MRTFKSYTARQVIDLLKKRRNNFYLDKLKQKKLAHHDDAEFQLWQEGYHPKQITGDDMMIQKIEYVHNNPIKRGYVAKPEDWRYSSACDYRGQKGLIPIIKFVK